MAGTVRALNRNRALWLHVGAASLLGLAGCGRGTPNVGAGSPQEAARVYVEALSTKDGERLCSVVAGYISDFYEDQADRGPGAITETAERDTGLEGCPLLTHLYIGYLDDAGTQWKRAEILDMRPHRHGELAAVSMRLRHHFREYPSDDPAPSRVEDDTVYLTREDGRWRVAKLSAVAEHASLSNEPLPIPSDIEDQIARVK